MDTKLFVHVEVPAEVGVDSLIKNIHHIGAAHGHVVLEPILADVFHQLLQVVHLGDGDAAIHAIGIIGDLTLAEVSLDTTLRVVGGDAEEGEIASGDLGIYCTEGIDLTHFAISPVLGITIKYSYFAIRATYQYRWSIVKDLQDFIGNSRFSVGVGVAF